MRFVHCILVIQHAWLASAFVNTNQNNVHVQSNSKSGAGMVTSTRLLDAPEPLAEEGSWQAFLDDETTGLIYYFDTKTGESLWEPPTSSFPAVRLPRKTQRMAEDLRKNYRKARQQGEAEVGGDSSSSVQVVEKTAEEAGSGLPSWIEGLVEVVEEKALAATAPAPAPAPEVVEETPKEEKEGWFSGFFADKGGAVAEEEEMALKVEKKEEKPNGEAVAQKEKGGLFAAFDGLKEKASSVIETETEVATPVPAVKKQPEKKKAKEPVIVDTSPKPIKIDMGSHILPHPAKVRWGGEDALFIKGRTFGVFDGVSGAEKLDGVPLYSRTLATEMKKAVGKESISIQEMTKLLTAAADYADDSATGASTAVVASIGENGFLQALNLGDSLCMVVRDGKIAAKTREISHYWECPYQLSDDSPDRPRDGTKLNVELIAGDVVLMGSDGIFDNVSDDMLLELIGKSARLNPSQLSKKMCDLSRKQSLDGKSVTPYAKQAQRRGDQAFKDGLGGKVDDTSCIVVVCK
jgi:protein phosphatase PTC7